MDERPHPGKNPNHPKCAKIEALSIWHQDTQNDLNQTDATWVAAVLSATD
jgi:hypothetical protein